MNEDCWLTERCSRIDCDTFCLKYFKTNILYDLALIPKNKRKHVLLRIDDDGSDEQAFNVLKGIEDNIVDFISKGKNLFLFSAITGNGKTLWSYRMVETYFNKIWLKSELRCRVLFISVPRYLLELKADIEEKSEYIKHIKDNVLTCDLVIWDDIATKIGTEFELSHLLSMIETRLTSGLSNIYTSNLSDKDLNKAIGDRLYSRIQTYSDYVIELKGKDKRGIKQ